MYCKDCTIFRTALVGKSRIYEVQQKCARIFKTKDGDMAKSNRKIILIMSDMHSGHKLGLLNPETLIEYEDEDGNIEKHTPDITKAQEYLWDVYTWGLEEVRKLAGKSPIYAWHNGDLTQGSASGKYPNNTVTPRDSDQITIAFFNLLPLMKMKNLKAFRVVYGTGWHVFNDGSSERVVSKMLKFAFPKIDIRSMYHSLANFGVVRIDVAHHGPSQSKRIWLEGNIARRYLRDLILKAVVAGDIVPDLVARAHIHQAIDEVVKVGKYESRIIVTPSLCFITEFARKVMRSISTIENGMVAFEVVDGVLSKPYWFTRKKDFRTREKI